MQYPRVITLCDKKNETLFTVDDFEYLIDKYMGADAVRYFRSLREEQSEREIDIGKYASELKTAVNVLNNRIAELECDFNDQ